MDTNCSREVETAGPDRDAGPTREWFATTRWTDILQAKNKEEAGMAQAALAKVCESYWAPIYSYLRHSGHSRSDAEDLAQGFFEHLLSRDWLEHVQPGKGKFRSFLLKCLKNFCLNARAKARAEKRGGKEVFIPLEDINREEEQLLSASDSLTPEQSFDRRWAEALMQRAIGRLRDEYVQGGKRELFDALKNVQDGEKGDCTYAQIGARFNLTEGALKTAVHRMRRRLSVILRLEVEATVGSRDEANEELRCLREALSPGTG